MTAKDTKDEPLPTADELAATKLAYDQRVARISGFPVPADATEALVPAYKAHLNQYLANPSEEAGSSISLQAPVPDSAPPSGEKS